MKLSGYTYVKNAVEMDYPFEESIRSHLAFCDEVVVVDASDKKDGTRDRLEAIKKDFPEKLKVFKADLDWTAPNYGIYDGVLKQTAREKCTGEFLWQFDSDELVNAADRPLLEDLIKQAGNLSEIPLLCLPVVEYWGSMDKVRVDINPWKWRVSRNHPEITHGIPMPLRKVENGLLYAKPGTDTCDYIIKSQGLPVPNLNFMNSENDVLRQQALGGDPIALSKYEHWFNQMAFGLPTVYHFSWFSIKSKIEKYRDFFGAFWKAMYNDNRNTNMFFNVPWEQVTEEMIVAKAKELSDGTGGWIFHQPWDGSKRPHVKILRQPPEIIKSWCDKHPI
jgi:hypothetical protein